VNEELQAAGREITTIAKIPELEKNCMAKIS